MGLDLQTWEALKRHHGDATNILCLGYPDLLVPEKVLRLTCDPKPIDPEAEARIAKWHGWKDRVFDTTAALKESFGLEAIYVDVKKHRGCEVVLDLNKPSRGLQYWDIVLDPGTLEHCFNIGQAFENVREMAKPGGIVIHVNPVNRPNHGFWSISPTAYYDFWTAHGGEILEARILEVRGQTEVDLTVETKARTAKLHMDFPANILVVVRAGERDAPKWPLQGKYA